MQILATDDEPLALGGVTRAIRQAVPAAAVCGFQRAGEALEFSRAHPCDIAFLDIEMRDMNGIELAKRLKGLYPQINIVFVTGYSQYATEAFLLHASGYVTKPVTPEKITQEIENLRFPPAADLQSRVRVQTFGNFEVFIGDEPVKFQYSKTKELFAFLVDRNGASCTVGEIIAVLWEDEGVKKKSYFRNLSADLLGSFAKLGHEEVIVKRRGSLAVAPDKLSCDYYDWNKGLPYAINAYRGEYMTQYSWAEITLSGIEISLHS